MKVWVITADLDYEGSIIEEVYGDEAKAQKRVNYLNKYISTVNHKYSMDSYKLKGTQSKSKAKVKNG